MCKSVGWSVALVCCLIGTSGSVLAKATTAQGAPATASEQREALGRTCRKMSNLQSVVFETRDDQATRIEGVAAYEFVRHRFGDDELVRFRGRGIARGPDTAWSLRDRLLVDGEAPPFLLQPELLFQVLGAIPESDLEFTRDVRVTRARGDVRILSMTVRGDGAAELAFSGALPRPSTTSPNLTAIVIAQRIGAPANRRLAKPDITYHLALHLDPDSGLVHDLHVRGEEPNSIVIGGNVIVRAGLPAGGVRVQQFVRQVRPPWEPAPAEAPAGAARAPQPANDPFDADGLPSAPPAKDRASQSLHATFRNHDLPFVPELDERARALLRYR